MFQNINICVVYAPLILAIHSNWSFYGKSELALGVETIGNTQESAVLHVRAGGNRASLGERKQQKEKKNPRKAEGTDIVSVLTQRTLAAPSAL